MKTLLKLEELAMFLLGIFLFSQLSFSWWWFLVFIMAPDIGMLGYLRNEKLGAWFYNLFHHKGLGLLLYLIGFFMSNQFMQFAGIILFAHASFDRLLGYGMKYEQGFKYTHLGEI